MRFYHITEPMSHFNCYFQKQTIILDGSINHLCYLRSEPLNDWLRGKEDIAEILMLTDLIREIALKDTLLLSLEEFSIYNITNLDIKQTSRFQNSRKFEQYYIYILDDINGID